VIAVFIAVTEVKNAHLFRRKIVVNKKPIAHLQAHCQSHTSQRCNQSFVKELASPCPEKEKQKISLRFAKIKSAYPQTDKRTLTQEKNYGDIYLTDRPIDKEEETTAYNIV